MESRLTSDPNLSKYSSSYRSLKSVRIEERKRQHRLPKCKAKGLPICPPESEGTVEEEEVAKFLDLPLVKTAKLFECPETVSIETDQLEEEEICEESAPATILEEPQTDDIQTEVERIKLRLTQLDCLLGLNIPECPEMDPCLDIDLELKKDLINPDILQLQRNNRKLQQQISQLEFARYASDHSMNKLKEMMTSDREVASDLQKQVNVLDSFKRTFEYEQVLCAQRYRRLEKEKYSGNQLHENFDKLQDNVESSLSKFRTRADYKSLKTVELQKIQKLHLRCKKLYDFMFESFEKLDTNIGIDPPMQSPELTAFMYRNEKLFSGQRPS